MLIAMHDADKVKFPNLALMKISTWHKNKGDNVCWYDPLWSRLYDKIYSSKVFSFTENEKLYGNVIYGGTGYIDKGIPLRTSPKEWDRCRPDYDLYGSDILPDTSLGFLTRGCPNNCPWCIVPEKEGDIRAYMDIGEFLEHNQAVLMDNNVLAHNHGIEQIEKIGRAGIKVDFNQGLDARLIDDGIAKRLSKIKWLAPVRLACDTKTQIKNIQKAVTLLRWHNVTPRRYIVYVLVRSIDDALERIRFLKGMDLDPWAQPYIDGKTEATNEQKDFARWVNHKAIFKTVLWQEYKKRKEIA